MQPISQLFPSCTYCHSIPDPNTWLTSTSEVAKTTVQLLTCGICYIKRYCSEHCAASDGKHLSRCQLLEKKISMHRLDQWIQSRRTAKMGSLTLHIDSTGRCTLTEKACSDSRLSLKVFQEGNLIAKSYYIFCTRASLNWRPEAEAFSKKRDLLARSKMLTQLGLRIIAEGQYRQAFQMMAEYDPENGITKRYTFLKQAVPGMIKSQLQVEEITEYARALYPNLHPMQVKFATTESYPSHFPEAYLKEVNEAIRTPHPVTKELNVCAAALALLNERQYEFAFLLIFHHTDLELTKWRFFAEAIRRHSGLLPISIRKLASGLGIPEHRVDTLCGRFQ